MECPKCGYEPTMAEQTSSPGICPSCEVVYAKYRARQRSQETDPRSYSVKDRIALGVIGAQVAVRAGRERRAEREAIEPDHVKVVAIQIPFLGLVWLVTKVILAALPAIALATIIVTTLASLIGGVFSGYSRYAAIDVSDLNPATSPPVRVSSALTAEERAAAKQTCTTVGEYAMQVMTARQGGVPMSELATEDHPGLASIVIAAYEKPRYQTESNVRREIEDYHNDVYLRCVKGTL